MIIHTFKFYTDSIRRCTDYNHHTLALRKGFALIAEDNDTYTYNFHTKLRMLEKIKETDGYLDESLIAYRDTLFQQFKELARERLDKEDYNTLMSCY